MLSNPTFWTGIAFFIFFALLYRQGVHQAVAKSLDDRSARIEAELSQALSLRIDAENLLKEFEAKRAGASAEAEEIVKNARAEAEQIAREAETRLNDYVKRRTEAAETRISQAEKQALADVRSAAADAAVRASEAMLRSQLTGPAADEFLLRSLNDVRVKLN